MRAGDSRWPLDDWADPLLMLRLSSLGDVILATSVIPLILERRPELQVDFLTRRTYAPLLQLVPGLRRVLEVEDTPGGEAYGHVLDLQGGGKGRRACQRWAPEAARVGYQRASLRRRWTVLGGGRGRGVPPLVARFAGAVAGGREIAPLPLPRIDPPAELVEEQREQLRRHGGASGLSVLINPGASRPLKEVPAELTSSLITRLGDGGAFVVRLDPPPEGSSPGVCGEWSDGPGPVAGFRGPLIGVAALLAAADVIITSDSGILHLATAVRTPAVALFGPTAPTLGFSPLGRSRAIGVELACRPCHVHGPRVCWLGHRRCWRDLSAKDIIAAALELAAGA